MYTTGTSNAAADALSRMRVLDQAHECSEGSCSPPRGCPWRVMSFLEGVIPSASFLFNLRIFVHFWNGDPVAYQDGRASGKGVVTVDLQCLGGIHFNALREGSSPIPTHNRQNLMHLVSVPLCEASKTQKAGFITSGTSDDKLCLHCSPSSHLRIGVGLAGEHFCGILDTG